MSELICTCHYGGTMFYRHLHDASCPCASRGDEAPESHPDNIAALRARVAALEQAETERIEWVKRAERAEAVNDELNGKLERLQTFMNTSQWHKENERLTAALADLTYTWTTARPTVAGWYWRRKDVGLFESICHVAYGTDGQLRTGLNRIDSEWMAGQWAGPIPMPAGGFSTK